MTFAEARERARRWEIAASQWCRQERGYCVLPTYDFSGKGDDKAPKILSPPQVLDLVAPDLLVWTAKGPRWLEVKWKDHAETYRRHGCKTTGINRRLWQHYCEVERLLKQPVSVLFIHQRERECRGDTVANLAKYIDHEYTGPLMGPSGMVFWPYDDIPRWFGLEVLEHYLPDEREAA